MKRIFAILVLAVSATLLTACSEKGETVVEDISATESIAVEATTVTTEEVTTSETEETTLAETEESTTAAIAQSNGGTYSADKDSLVGTWYAIDIDLYGNMTYTLKEDGSFEVLGDYEEESGTYTINDGLLECSLCDDYDEYYTQSMAAVIDEDVLILSCIGYDTELIREEYAPYEAGRSVYDYISEVDLYNEPLFMTREKPVFAEQEDIFGEWVVRRDDKVIGKCIFAENSITQIENGEESTLSAILEDGRMTAVGEIPENMSLYMGYVYLCGEKLYIFNDEFPIILEKEE